MSALRIILARIRGLFGKSAADRALETEIRNHIELQTQLNIGNGLPPAEARRAARQAFGPIEAVKEAHRDARGIRWVEEGMADIRFAIRTLIRNPAHAAAAIITLALGVGVNTAIFSVVNSVVLRPLPFPAPDRLMMLSEENAEKHWHHNIVAPANYLDWRSRVKAFEDVAAYQSTGGMTLTGDDAPALLQVSRVTGNFMNVLGGRAELGRTLDSAETWLGGMPVVVLSHGTWMNRFGGKRDIIGRTIQLSGVATQVVGVMPESFTFPFGRIDAWAPIRWDRNNIPQVFFRRAHMVRAVARLKPGVTEAQAMSEFQDVVHQLQREYPVTNKVMGADMTPLHDFLIGDVRLPLLILQGAVITLLLIACANVGNLLLVLAAAREREAALRLTLGASFSRLVRQVLTESLTLSFIGGAFGVGLGLWGTRVLTRLEPANMQPVGAVQLDCTVFAYILGVVTISAFAFGAAPALWNRRQAPAQVLREGGRSSSQGRTGRRWASALVIAEVALALVLTSGAGLLLRSFQRLLSVDPGFASHGVLATAVQIPSRQYDTDAKTRDFYGQALERIRALPGVSAADMIMVPPMRGTGFTSDYHVAGRGPDDYGTEVAHNLIGSGYLATMHIPLLAGRSFTPTDGDSLNPVILINAALAKQAFPDADPIGQRISFDKHPDSTSQWYTVVGVIGDTRQSGLASQAQIEVFEPFTQGPRNFMTLIVRTNGDPLALARPIRQIITDIDRNVPLSSIDTMDDLVSESIATQRFLMLLLVAFAVTGLTLAVVGVYGVMAQTARGRRREIGIRVALGAQTRGVQWLVVREGLLLTASGAALGLAGSLMITRLIASALYEVKPADPVTLGTVTVVLLATATAATWIPARSVSRTDPAVTLRAE